MKEHATDPETPPVRDLIIVTWREGTSVVHTRARARARGRFKAIENDVSLSSNMKFQVLRYIDIT